jgi:hypothetical protein
VVLPYQSIAFSVMQAYFPFEFAGIIRGPGVGPDKTACLLGGEFSHA